MKGSDKRPAPEQTSGTLAEIDKWFDRHRERILAEWFEFLRFPSVGTDPVRATDCDACAVWLRDYVARLGFESEVLNTSGRPVVYAERLPQPPPSSAMEVLFYGHYDVQPEDPVDAWFTRPFDPVLRDGRVFARGAEDNKGQLFYFLQAVTFLLNTRCDLPPLHLLIEGEEESGSEGLAANLDTWRHRLRSDVLMVCDTNRDVSGRPAVTAGLRGIVSAEVALRGGHHDLHSGLHGGVAPNPIHGMARLLSSLHDEQGCILVPGFLDRVRPPAPLEQSLLQQSAFDATRYETETGVPPAGGESGRSVAERLGFRPTIEVNGIWGGYTGTGMKTIIPAEARAKVSCRLCPDQDPRESLEQLLGHLKRHVPEGLRLDISDTNIGGPGFRLRVGSPLFMIAEDVLSAVDSRGPVYRWEGASIPIVSALRDVSGAAPLLVGFGSEEDRVHAPNESFSLDQFRQGLVYSVLMLQRLAAGN